MSSLVKSLTLMILCWSVLPATTVIAHTQSQLFRYLSITIRDRGPSTQEAKDFYYKKKSLNQFIDEWLASEDHKQRVKRFFSDMFGHSPYVFIAVQEFDLIEYQVGNDGADAPPSDLSTTGVYHLPSFVKSTCGSHQTVSAWWSDEDITVCATAVSSFIRQSTPTELNCALLSDTNGIGHTDCGCGPDLVLCHPRKYKHKSRVAVANEIQDRALHVYDNDKSWLKLFGSNEFYGDRWLYHHYLYQQKIAVRGEPPTAAEMTTLKSLPAPTGDEDFSKAVATFPSDFPVANGPQRAGIVTAPSFLRRFNNFRSRIRALTENLLCKDVDSSLDPSVEDAPDYDAMAPFFNDDLSAFDKVHGVKDGCKNCHIAMDNHASTLLGWVTDGYFEGWRETMLSKEGYVFGESGNGPQFLMEGYVNRASGFHTCMAKRVWQDFTGNDWSLLSDKEKGSFITSSKKGPRSLIRDVLKSSVLQAQRTTQTTTKKTIVTVVYDFYEDVNPILSDSCAGSSCHSQGTSLGKRYEYIDNKENFSQAPINRVLDQSMPPASSGLEISDLEREILAVFLNQ